MDWQPIETAPTDGTRVLLWANVDGDWHVVIGLFRFNDWDVTDPDSGCDARAYPLYWMPLPDLP